ncbi:GNAT family N-acetyltransferase [Croceivirga sp. JEA036]|uniref:GNAT family N-acetyltransferase n=1 Tax=Croceivirga sp. JEA036 TaxID=2721162 RepID=UPI00143ABE29|nr:GNAT family N-acetyltransferase [Croceivirga sp. JEA036]NJB37359.1 GNAT family N-acetyltransferase [Croceivirga sp. JEA036]
MSSSYLLEGEETERLFFRKVLPSDFDAWLPFHQDKRSSQYWYGLPQDPKTACTQQFEGIFERYQNNTGGMNALISKQTNELVGLCGLLLQEVDDKMLWEIGYSILPQYWQQGYATEAATACKIYATQKQLAQELISIIAIKNLPSIKVAEKNGMKLNRTTIYKGNTVGIYTVHLS